MLEIFRKGLHHNQLSIFHYTNANTEDHFMIPSLLKVINGLLEPLTQSYCHAFLRMLLLCVTFANK